MRADATSGDNGDTLAYSSQLSNQDAQFVYGNLIELNAVNPMPFGTCSDKGKGARSICFNKQLLLYATRPALGQGFHEAIKAAE